MGSRYRMVIVACCFLLLFVNQGLTATSFNVYQPYIVALPGVGNVGGSAVLTVRTFVSLLALLVVGALYRRVSLRAGVAAATALTALGFVVYGCADSLGMLCIGSVLTGIGYGFGGMVATTMIVSNWYRGHLGTILGVVGMGAGVASMVMPVVLAAIIEGVGLSEAFLVEAAVALALGALAVALLRSRPEDRGLAPVDEAPVPAARRGCRVRVGTAMLPAADKRLMMACMVLLGAVAVVGYGYFSVLLTSSGIGFEVAAALTAVLGAALTASKLACGWFFDLVGTRAGSLAFFGLLVAGLVLCYLAGAGGDVDGFFAAVLFGIGVSVATTGMSVWALELSSPDGRLKLVRDFTVAYAFGGFAFNLMPGLLANATGSYGVSYLVFAVMAAACALIVMVVYARHRHRIEASASGKAHAVRLR